MIETRHREDGGGVPDPGDQNGIIIKAEKNTSIEEIQLDEPIGIVLSFVLSKPLQNVPQPDYFENFY